MEENKLQINEKLFSFEGIIGRHAYFLNIVIICALSALIMIPYTGYIYTHLGTFTDLFEPQKMFLNSPLLLKLWVFFGTIGICSLSVSNIFRRLNDIFGEVKTGTNITLSAIRVLASLSFLFPFFIGILFYILSFILGIILLFTKGKITSTLPYDYKKEFNWGAFFGTWIWGICNKSFIPFWMLLLWITPFSLYFQLYCGLKGNEWAFKNKKHTDVEKFNKSQETQSIIFTVLSLVVLPILYIIIVMVVIFSLVFSSLTIDKNMTPEQRQQKFDRIETNMNKFLDWAVSIYFERYEIEENENKFYVTDSDWRSADFKDKKDMLELAATKSAEIRSKKFKEQNRNGYKHFSKTSELPRTKIYSSESNKLLGEFIMDESAMNGSFKDAFTAAIKAYRFYSP